MFGWLGFLCPVNGNLRLLNPLILIGLAFAFKRTNYELPCSVNLRSGGRNLKPWPSEHASVPSMRHEGIEVRLGPQEVEASAPEVPEDREGASHRVSPL